MSKKPLHHNELTAEDPKLILDTVRQIKDTVRPLADQLEMLLASNRPGASDEGAKTSVSEDMLHSATYFQVSLDKLLNIKVTRTIVTVDEA